MHLSRSEFFSYTFLCRYEDASSCPDEVFSCGITASSISVVSTDENYQPGLHSDRLVYKLLSVENFACYWQPHSERFSHNNNDKEGIKEKMKMLINATDSGLKYGV